MHPTILVTGATGKQGGATARHLLAKGLRVNALVRTTSSAAAVDLHRRGAVLVEGNFDQPERLQLACQNATAVFLNVSPSFRGDGAELRQATNIVRAARASGSITTLVYSSVCAVDQREEFPGWHDGTMSGILKGYFESKGSIEDLVRSAGFMHWTILRPPVFMTNYLPPSVRGYFPELAESYTLRTAMAPEKRTMLLHPDDIGLFAAAALVEPGRFSHRAIEIGGEALTAEQVARAISEVSGREIVVDHIPRDMAERLAPSNPQIDSQLWFWERQDGIEPRELEAEFGFKLTTFKEFLTANQELVRETFG
ncbi:NAD(P)-binding domain [Penicillium camemberti]|uniref:NAD(P)-binding domain n=1 Tax=Penicillium camemberti (strain FM 013) TaxID=1429867 RepID=A0A0G4P4W3_PENC3|nr:NAD(P)-binding domain [Penicillium camemberti]